VQLVERAGRGVAEFLKLKASEIVVTGAGPISTRRRGGIHRTPNPNNFLSAKSYIPSYAGVRGGIVFEDRAPQVQRDDAPISEFTPYKRQLTSLFDVEARGGGAPRVFHAWLTIPCDHAAPKAVSMEFNLHAQQLRSTTRKPGLGAATVRLRRCPTRID